MEGALWVWSLWVQLTDKVHALFEPWRWPAIIKWLQ